MKISDEQKIKLESMQIKGIRWMIWNNIDKEDIESRLLQIKNQGSINEITKFVNSQSRATLIQLIECSPEITPLIIDAAYEKKDSLQIGDLLDQFNEISLEVGN